MGVAYQATDNRLGLKLLHEQLLASLNHLNIAAIHGLEQAGEVKFPVSTIS